MSTPVKPPRFVPTLTEVVKTDPLNPAENFAIEPNEPLPDLDSFQTPEEPIAEVPIEVLAEPEYREILPFQTFSTAQDDDEEFFDLTEPYIPPPNSAVAAVLPQLPENAVAAQNLNPNFEIDKSKLMQSLLLKIEPILENKIQEIAHNLLEIHIKNLTDQLQKEIKKTIENSIHDAIIFEIENSKNTN